MISRNTHNGPSTEHEKERGVVYEDEELTPNKGMCSMSYFLNPYMR
jgi:hypothetical protein